MLQSPCGCPFRAVIILTLLVFSNVKLSGECWVYSKTRQLRKVSVGQLRSFCVVITPSTNMTHHADNSRSAKIVVSCPRHNACPFMMRAHLIGLHSSWPFAHSSKQDVQSEGGELCFPINLALPFYLNFPGTPCISSPYGLCRASENFKQAEQLSRSENEPSPNLSTYMKLRHECIRWWGGEPLIMKSWEHVSGTGHCMWLILGSLFTI